MHLIKNNLTRYTIETAREDVITLLSPHDNLTIEEILKAIRNKICSAQLDVYGDPNKTNIVRFFETVDNGIVDKFMFNLDTDRATSYPHASGNMAKLYFDECVEYANQQEGETCET